MHGEYISIRILNLCLYLHLSLLSLPSRSEQTFSFLWLGGRELHWTPAAVAQGPHTLHDGSQALDWARVHVQLHRR
jgi:hypothetical protein